MIFDERKQHIYIDTSYIQSYLMPIGDEERYRKEQVRRAVEKTKKNKEIFIKFPLIVAGELINNLSKERMDLEDKQEVIGKFFKVLNNKIDLIPARTNSLKLAADIKNKDHLLGDTDLLIVAQAICDINSTHLLIKDKDIIESREIDEAERNIEERQRKLKISDSIK
jgi:hypothetical protein